MRSRIPDLERFLASIAASLMLLISQAGFLWPEQSAAQARTNCVKTASHKSAGHSKNSSVSGHHRSKAGHSSSGHRKASARTASGRHRSRSTRASTIRHSSRATRSGRKRMSPSPSPPQHHQHQPAAHYHHPASVEAQAQAPQDLNAEPRARNYALLGRAYSLYDQGINDRLKGNFGAAVDKLTESSSLFDQARSHQHNGNPSTLEAMVFYELGQAAEADGDFTLARDSYARCLKARPGYVEGYLHIANVLSTQGNLPLAMQWLKEGVTACPGDVRLNEMLTRLAVFMGESQSLENPVKTQPSTTPADAIDGQP